MKIGYVINADLCGFVKDKVNTHQPWVTKSGYTPVQQANKRHTVTIH